MSLDEISNAPQANCGNCVCFIVMGTQAIEKDAAPIRVGFCRFNPPTPIAVTVQTPSKIAGAQPTVQTRIEPTFAATNEAQWCAQHMTEAEYFAERAPDSLDA